MPRCTTLFSFPRLETSERPDAVCGLVLALLFLLLSNQAEVTPARDTEAGGRKKNIGLVRTMVHTHIPANILLCLVPLMPNLWSALIALLARASISQMGVPVRQSSTMAVVAPDEQSAASGITTVARSVGAAASPLLAGLMMANPLLFSTPFFLAGGLKIAYDLLLYQMFKDTEEQGPDLDREIR